MLTPSRRRPTFIELFRWLAVALLVSGLGCAKPRPITTVGWGPLEAGKCDETGKREYSATLRKPAASSRRCDDTSHNVMGARFDRPEPCEGDVGHWRVRDWTCASSLPDPPRRGEPGGVAGEMEGYADLHNHLFAHLGFGETVVWGKLTGDPATALPPIDDEIEGPHDAITRITRAAEYGLGALFRGHREDGHPTYTGWPHREIQTHQQSYIDWLHRAYVGGQRLVVAHAVNNQDMFGRGEVRRRGFVNAAVRTILWLLGPWVHAKPAPGRTSNDMEALEHQVRAARSLEAEAAARIGQPWLVLAETPEEAAEAIEAGKLAVVLGSEVDHLFNCDLDRHCDEARIREGLDKLEALGFAVLFPTHHKQTQLGGAASFHPLSTGPEEDCPFSSPCSAVGLSPLGRFLVREMMQRGMLVDLGHAGARPFADTIGLLETEDYPVVMSHASAHPLKPEGSAEYTLTWEQLDKIKELGGMVSFHRTEGEYARQDNSGARIPLSCEEGAGGFVQSYLYTLDALDGGLVGERGQIALALDWNGFSSWPGPRNACEPREAGDVGPLPKAPEIVYPFPLPPSLKQAASGGAAELDRLEWPPDSPTPVTYDFNQVGLVHAGLQPDLIEDMRQHGLSEADLEPFYRSARGFVEMWRDARARRVSGDRGWLRWIPQSPTDLIDLEVDESRYVTTGSRPICRLRGSRQWGVLLADGSCRVVEGSAPMLPPVIPVGPIRNANSGRCLAAERGTRAGSEIVQENCVDAARHRWAAEARPGGVHRVVSELAGLCVEASGAELVQAVCGDGPSQAWILERRGNTFRLREAGGDRCVHVRDRGLRHGDPLRLETCPAPGRADFHWEMDGLRDAVDHERLFSVRATSETVAWKANADARHPHLLHGSLGRPICRPTAGAGALGTLHRGACEYRDAQGGDGSTRSYELLLATEPLASD